MTQCCKFIEDDNISGWRCTECRLAASERIHFETAPIKNCSGFPARSRGLGDTIAKVTNAVGIPACKSCKDRQAKLNKLVPYRGG